MQILTILHSFAATWFITAWLNCTSILGLNSSKQFLIELNLGTNIGYLYQPVPHQKYSI